MTGLRILQEIADDARHGGRLLLKTPGFAVVAVVTLALGIGANTAIFSVVNTVLLKSLPYAESDRLVVLDEYRLQHGSRTVSWMDFLDWRKQNSAFEDLAAYRLTRLSLTGVNDPTLLRVAEVSSSFFKLLGVKPVVGRNFTEQEDKAGATRTAVISYAMWRGRFGGDPNIGAKAIDLDGAPASVIGVLPPAFDFFDQEVDVYLPVGLHAGNGEWNRRGIHPDLLVLARLRPTVSLESARSQMKALMQRLETEYPHSNAGLTATVVSLYEHQFETIRPVLLALFAAVAGILLIALVNVANLMLARGSSRQKEMAVRTALGASRKRLTRQLMTENVLLSGLGGSLGLLLAYGAIAFVVKLAPNSSLEFARTKIDTNVLLFTFVLSVATGILFGLAPAFQASRFDLNSTLNEGSNRIFTSRNARRLRSILLVVEIGAAMGLVYTAGLATRSLRKVMTTKLGFDIHHVLSLDLTLPRTKYLDPEQRAALFLESVKRLRAIPGAVQASAVSCPPLVGICFDNAFMLADHPVASVVDLPTAASNIIVPGYFEAMRIPLIKGRTFQESDNRHSRMVAIVNESFARRWWPNESAIGKQLREGGPQGGQPYRIVIGVVGDSKQNGLEGEPRPEVFLPSTQFPFAPWDSLDAMTFSVRTNNDPMALAETAARALQALDPDLPVTAVYPMTRYAATSLARREFATLLLIAFGGLALMLASVGTYGVMAYNVSRRVQEIGTRMALGATPGRIRQLILQETLRLTSAGIALGLLGSFICARWLSRLLFGIKADDPGTLVAVIITLVASAFVASYVPVNRASKIEPAQAIRCE